MAEQQVLCMVGGTGGNSYANNSSLQKTAIIRVRALLEENIEAICSTISPECLTIADLGCSSGPNALSVLKSIIGVVVSTCRRSGRQIPDLNVFMNDLPQNDFNTIFKSLPGFYKWLGDNNGVEVPCCVSGTPGSFYDRLFPSNLVHFIHSSYSLHWLSQVPKGLTLNEGSIEVKKGCPPEVLKAYQEQFERDFTKFLRWRSREIVKGGRALLTFLATHEDEAFSTMEFTSKALNKLASRGLIDKEKLDAFNLPFYRPTIKEVKQLIEDEGSFTLHKLETFNIPWNAVIERKVDQDNKIDLFKGAKLITCTIRGVSEPLLASQFGEEVMAQVFNLVEEFVMDRLVAGQEISAFNLAISLIRNAY